MTTGDSAAAPSENQDATPTPAESSPPEPEPTSAGPLAQVIRSGPLAARGAGIAKPTSPTVDPSALMAAAVEKPAKNKEQPPRSRDDRQPQQQKPQTSSAPKSKVAVPNRRQALSDDIQAELEAELAAADFDSILGGNAGMADRKLPLAEGDRVHAQILKIHGDSVFIALGGPDEGVVPFVQFEQEPVVGSNLEVIIRGINREDGLYILSLPGGAIDVTDWEDLEEGSTVEATVTGNNAGGLECKVGGVKGFIPISQISEYRVEDTSEFVDQRFLCVVTEANMRRGNLVLSRRAVLEREREEKRKQQLAQIEVGHELEGIVRSIKDFGAFVDLGGVDGLIHISKLSWDRVKHPSEVLEVGQKVKVRIDALDKETSKISLSYRDLLENPWDTAEAEFAVGTVHTGTVTRVAPFGCFVKLAVGVEGLVHISELAHHRVSKVDSVVNEGQEVEVKVLSFDRDSQKIALSVKAAQQAPVQDPATGAAEETPEPVREPEVKPMHSGPLKGGNNTDTGGERFGLRW